MEGHDEAQEIERLLQSCLQRLDGLGAQVPAVHLEMCLNELSRFITAENLTPADD